MGDTIYYIVLAIALGGMLITWWRDHQAEKQMEEEREEESANTSSDNEEQDANNDIAVERLPRDLFLDFLHKYGCQYDIDEDNAINFAYQGEHFTAFVTNECFFLDLWDTHWLCVDLNDIDEVSKLRRIINDSNIEFKFITTFYTIDEAEQKMMVHGKSTIPFASTMPHIESFLKGIFLAFFHTHQYVLSEMQKL